MNVQTLPVKNNLAEHRFEIQLGDKFGEIVYRKEGSVYTLEHTEVPKEFRGQGIADHLVHEALEQIKAENGKIVALCPFVKVYLRRHPQYQPLVVDSRQD